MILSPFHYQFDKVFEGEREEKISETIKNEQGENLGRFELYLIDGNDELKGFVDQYRDEICYNWYPMDVFHAIEYDDDHCEIDGKIVYLKSIIINEEYRNKGIGTRVINEIIRHFKEEKVNYLILQPSPIHTNPSVFKVEEDEEDKEKRIRLTQYYQREFNFQKVQTIEKKKYPIYYLKLN